MKARPDLQVFKPHHDLAQTLLRHVQTLPSDTAHDVSHLLRVWQNVRRIQSAEGGNLQVLVAATMLHDCVHVPKDSPDRSVASRKSAHHASQVLRNMAWPDELVSSVAHAIEAHSFSAKLQPTTLEARILQDADRLDALGHIGIARCFAVSGSMGRPLYDPLDPAAHRRPLNDTAFALDHFSTKLLKLSEGFQTSAGRKLAAKRHAVVQAFLTGILDEL